MGVLDTVITLGALAGLGYFVIYYVLPRAKIPTGVGPSAIGGAGSVPRGGTGEGGVRLMHPTTGKSVAIQKGSNHRNGQRYNVNHSFKNYLSIGYYRIGKGQQAMNHKTDGPNHGGCSSTPKCVWSEPQLEIPSGKVVMNAEYPHPKSHDNLPCPSCKSVGTIRVGQYVGWAVAAYQTGQFRTIEVWVDPKGLIGGRPANAWILAARETDRGQITGKNATRQLPTGGRGLEAEIRMHGAKSGDTDLKFGKVYEIVPPTGSAYTFTYVRKPRKLNNTMNYLNLNLYNYYQTPLLITR